MSYWRFLKSQAIYPKLVRKFKKNAKLVEENTIVFLVLGEQLFINMANIFKEITTKRVPNCFYPMREKV